jgi:formamidopyrimidine-DNA glycosylase
MPELPEVETVCRGLQPYITKQQIRCVSVYQPSLRYKVADDLPEVLTGQTIQCITRRAKYIVMQLDKGYLVIHLGMSGRLTWQSLDAPLAKHDHIELQFPGGLLRYNDTRRFGCFLWTADYASHKLFSKLGVEPLTAEFTGLYLYHQAAKKNKVIKSFIMDNAIVVGVGNIYASEALFASKLHPTNPAHILTLAQCNSLVENIKAILAQAIASGGTTLQDFASVDGKLGYFVQELKVYGRVNQECVECSSKIKQLVLNQRNSFYCDTCQL